MMWGKLLPEAVSRLWSRGGGHCGRLNVVGNAPPPTGSMSKSLGSVKVVPIGQKDFANVTQLRIFRGEIILDYLDGPREITRALM